MRRWTVLLTALALVALPTLFLIGGCGGADEGGVKTYENQEYGITFDYDAGTFTATDEADTSSNVGNEGAFKVAYFDKDGAKTDGEYRDGFIVTVYELSQTITADMMPLVKTELESMLPDLAAGLGADTQIEPLTDVTVGTVPGYTTEATYTMGGADIKASLYFLVAGDLEYQVTFQAAAESWDALEPQFRTVIDSMRFGPDAAGE